MTLKSTTPNQVVGELMVSKSDIKITFRSGHIAMLKEVKKKAVISLVCKNVITVGQQESLKMYFKLPIEFIKEDNGSVAE